MSTIKDIYHGSSIILEHPYFGGGRRNNDFGLGFYCTESEDLAKEWAVSSLKDGFSNHYHLTMDNLRVLNLNSPDYTILNWIAVLVDNRAFILNNPVARRAKGYLMNHFSINVNAYDVIIGYRADDAYFSYAEAFLNNNITVSQLAKAMKLGHLGEQIVVKSEYAFSELSFVDYSIARKEEYYIRRKERNESANQAYERILLEEEDGLFIQDIIRGGIVNDDPRIPRNLPE